MFIIMEGLQDGKMKALPYDDPYAILAARLVVRYPRAEVSRLMRDPRFVKNMVAREFKSLDLAGDFLDCIISDLCSTGRRMEYVEAQNRFSIELAEKIDYNHLKMCIENICDQLGVILD